MQFDKIFMPKQVDKKEVIWGHIPFVKIPFTKRDLVFFIISTPLIYPLYKLYIFLFNPRAIIDIATMVMTLISVPLFITLLSRIKNNGFYIEKIVLNRFKYMTTSKLTLNEKILNRLKDKED